MEPEDKSNEIKEKKTVQLNKPLLLTCLGSLLMFLALFFGVFLRTQQRSGSLAPEAVFFGDSLIAVTNEGCDFITERIGESCGMQILDASFGGTCMAYGDVEGRLDKTADAMCMASLAQAILSKDFRLQQNARIRSAATEYFDAHIDLLEQVDFTQVRIVFIEQCLNDYHSGALIWGENVNSTYNYGGALRYVLSSLKEAYPELRIILVTPTYTWYPVYGLTCEERDLGGGVLEDYVNVMKALAVEQQVELIDLYSPSAEEWGSGAFEDWQYYTVDGIHPIESTRTWIVEHITAYLQANP